MRRKNLSSWKGAIIGGGIVGVALIFVPMLMYAIMLRVQDMFGKESILGSNAMLVGLILIIIGAIIGHLISGKKK